MSISSKVAGVKKWSRGGGDGGRERAEVEEGLVCRLKCSFEILSEKYVANSCGFEILSEKYVANSCGRAARGDYVDRERLAVLCRIFVESFPKSLRFR